MTQPVALVTGATGFIGSHLVPALVRGGWAVRAIGRRDRPGDLAAEVDYRRADLVEPTDGPDHPGRPGWAHDHLVAAARGVTHVFHLAGASSSLSSQEEMERTNIEGTARLIGALEQAGAAVDRFVHMSSTSVYGEEEQLPSPVPESIEPHPSRGYGKAKWGAEQQVWKAVAAGLPAVVLRPVTVYGPGNVKLLASAILDAAIEAEAGLDRFEVPAVAIEQRLLHIDDLVAATVHVAGSESATGRAFNVVLPHYPTSHELAGSIAAGFGLTVELSDNAEPGLAYQARAQTHARMVAAGMRPEILLTTERLRLMGKANRNNRLSVEALEGTGFRFAQTDLQAGIATTIAWYRANRWLPAS